jgi:hypothetical protein
MNPKALREVVPPAPPPGQELRCFFCYGRFEPEEAVFGGDHHSYYHQDCLQPLLVAHEAEGLTVPCLDGSPLVLKGYKPAHSLQV